MPARWSPGGICSPTCGECPTAGPTRRWTSTSRGCAASSGRRRSIRDTSTPCAGSGSSSALHREPAMRLRIVLLVLAASSLVLISVLAALWVLLRPQPHTWLVLGCVGLGAPAHRRRQYRGPPGRRGPVRPGRAGRARRGTPRRRGPEQAGAAHRRTA